MEKLFRVLCFSWIGIVFFFSSCNNNEEISEKSKDEFLFQDSIPSIANMVADSTYHNVDSIFSILEKKLSKVRLDDDDSTYYYVVEGDLLMDDDELYFYCQNKFSSRWTDSSLHAEKTKNKQFTVSTYSGQLEKWPNGFVIKYAVMRNSFEKRKDYDSTVAWMQRATKDWMTVCNIRFQYLPEYDGSETFGRPAEPLTFIVRQLNTGGAFIAQAFFPADIPKRKKLCVDPTFFSDNLGFNKIGVLRHELGHILGARHEHIWSKENECQGENIIEGARGAKQITTYDPYSVMHYLCGKAGTRALELTPFDVAGAQYLYGAPNQ